MKPELLNGANLAFIGDAYYELYIRNYLLEKDITKQHDLQKLTASYVSAKAQSKIIHELWDLFSEAEIALFKRGRNHKYNISRKNLKKDEYLNSSGFEALIGALYLEKSFERLEFILNKAIHIIEEKQHE
ncbi:MAG: ribonuclease III domain-containing protein [Bacilli bacterium]|nr:ribonuclease III domain-containing protein [Bacilli bacterium]